MNETEMAQPKDTAMKLFGRKIPVTNTQMPASSLSKGSSSEVMKDQRDNESSDQEKDVKKPDKIIPCPQCNSLETKFCYFNNYNVNQPRHFCRNCQRYWTAGGTMRNVPVGAGRRKNKHLPSQFCELLASSDGIHVAMVEHSDPATRQLVLPADATSSLITSTGNGVVLKFAPEAPLCASMEEPSSSGSSITAGSNQTNEEEDITRQENVSFSNSSEDQSLLHLHTMQLQSFTPIVFLWNPLWNNSSAIEASKCSTGPVLAVQGFCPPNIPVNFIPASCWGSTPVWATGTGNMSLVGSNGCPSPSSTTSISYCTGNGSSTLGKHNRDSDLSEEEKTEKYLFAPKTQRIDQSNEASKSPFWDALGLKPDGNDVDGRTKSKLQAAI